MIETFDKLTVEQRFERLKKGGYNPHHLFGSWYISRRRSKRYCRFSLYTIFRLKEDDF